MRPTREYTREKRTSTHSSEAALVGQLRQGDRRAFEHLCVNYHRALLGTILNLVNDPGEAEDLLQDTYLKVWQRFHRYDPERSGLFHWLYTIARNTALDALRRRKTRPVTLTLCPESTELPMTASSQPLTDLVGIQPLVRQILPPLQWQVVDLAYWQGYTYAEVADELGLPLGTVKSRIRQALIQLRPLF